MFSNFKTTQNRREGNMKKLIKTSFGFFAVFALMITFSFQQVTAAEKIRWKIAIVATPAPVHTPASSKPMPSDAKCERYIEL